MSNPWYARYPGDYARDTAHLSLVEHGAYTLLLDHYYSTSGPLPADITALYRICRAFDETERKAVDSILLRQFFNLQSNTYHNSRADMELVRRTEQHERLSSSGRRGAEKRWKDSQAISPAIGQDVASPQPQPQPEEKKKNAAKPTPPADPRHKPFFDFAYEAFRMKFLQPPSWGAAHAKGLQAFLKRSPKVDLAEWQRRYQFFLASTDRFFEQQKGSLLFFAGKFDQFIDGPILEKGNGSGKKLTGSALTGANLRATGLLQ